MLKNLDEIIEYIPCSVWLLLLSMVFLKFICVTCISTEFLFVTEWYATVYIPQGLFTRSQMDRHGGCQFLASLNRATMSLLMRIFV